jgi:hypothetical protein
MKPIWKFRLLALLMLAFVGGVSIANLAADFLRPAPSPFPSRTSKAPTPDQISSAGRAAAIAPFRSDLNVDYALALASQTLKSEYTGQAPSDESAKNAIKSALKMGPHDSGMWLALALLQARSDLGDSLVVEALKMSYLTSPNNAELVPVRLDAVTLGNTLNDAELKELARGDVRAILTQFPDQHQALVSDYVRGSSIGKAFLEESVRMFDPKFADSLLSAK